MAQCKDSDHHPLEITVDGERRQSVYTNCWNCGAIYDPHGRQVITPSRRCPGWASHHDGDICLECGLDERKGGFKTCPESELQNLRMAQGLSPMSEFLQWDKERSNLYRRIKAGEVIPVEEYQNARQR